MFYATEKAKCQEATAYLLPLWQFFDVRCMIIAVMYSLMFFTNFLLSTHSHIIYQPSQTCSRFTHKITLTNVVAINILERHSTASITVIFHNLLNKSFWPPPTHPRSPNCRPTHTPSLSPADCWWDGPRRSPLPTSLFTQTHISLKSSANPHTVVLQLSPNP